MWFAHGVVVVVGVFVVVLLADCNVRVSLNGVWYRSDGTVSGFWVPSVVQSGR